MEEVCFRVTTFAMGVVRSLEKEPARNPTLSSSKIGKCLLESFEDRIRDCRRKL